MLWYIKCVAKLRATNVENLRGRDAESISRRH